MSVCHGLGVVDDLDFDLYMVLPMYIGNYCWKLPLYARIVCLLFLFLCLFCVLGANYNVSLLLGKEILKNLLLSIGNNDHVLEQVNYLFCLYIETRCVQRH